MEHWEEIKITKGVPEPSEGEWSVMRFPVGSIGTATSSYTDLNRGKFVMKQLMEDGTWETIMEHDLKDMR